MATMTRAAFAKSLQDGLNTFFGMEYDQWSTEYTDYLAVEQSEKAYEEDQQLVGLGLPMETAEGADYPVDAGQEGWTKRYTHRKLALSFVISEEAQDDNRYMQLGPKYSRSMARSFRQADEVYSANIFNNATSTSYLGGDGKPLLATDHPLAMGGTFSNKLATAADFSESSLEQILIQVRDAVDDRGIPVMLNPVKVVTSTANEYNVRRVLYSDGRTGTADNDINAVKQKGVFRSEPCIVTNITDTDFWGVTTDCPDGLKRFDRKKMLTPKVSIDPHNGSFLYRGMIRFSEGWTDPRGFFGSEGAA